MFGKKKNLPDPTDPETIKWFIELNNEARHWAPCPRCGTVERQIFIGINQFCRDCEKKYFELNPKLEFKPLRPYDDGDD